MLVSIIQRQFVISRKWPRVRLVGRLAVEERQKHYAEEPEGALEDARMLRSPAELLAAGAASLAAAAFAALAAAKSSG